MEADRARNLIGALALAVADDIIRTTSALAPDGGPTASAIVLIGHEPGVSIRALSAGVSLSHAGTVRLVDRLAAEGLVDRRAGPDDRRERALHLTDRGATMCAAMLRGRGGVLERGLASLTSSEMTMLADLSERMLRMTVTGTDKAYRICRLCDYEACTACPVDAELEEGRL